MVQEPGYENVLTTRAENEGLRQANANFSCSHTLWTTSVHSPSLP
jgi:hypothetical protein